jgi:hypothetical protein
MDERMSRELVAHDWLDAFAWVVLIVVPLAIVAVIGWAYL